MKNYKMMAAGETEGSVDFCTWAESTAKSGGRFGMARVLRRVYEKNAELFRRWGRHESDGIVGAFGDRSNFLNGTNVYAHPITVEDIPACGVETMMGCVNADCVDTAENLARKGYNPAILNLASRRHACGGYDSGKSAQEEGLCQSSTLSQSLYQYFKPSLKCVQEAYVPMRYNAYPLDINYGGIYSPKVCFFRHGKDRWFAFRDNPFTCGVITVAALSFREPNHYCNEERNYMAAGGGFTPTGEEIQRNKIRTIFRIALKNGHDSIVPGAFGCGVNKLPSDAVAQQFKRVAAEPEFAGKFKALVFAIREGQKRAGKPVEEKGKFAPFYETFGRWN